MKKLKDIVKKSIIGKFMYLIRDIYRFPNGLFLINKIKKNKNVAILLGVPTFNNLGDHLIAISSVNFIQDIYKDYKIIEVPTQFFLNNKNKLKKVIKDDYPVFIVGGGWMGNIWERDEYIMQDMIRTFSNNNIIVLPQTVFYNFEDDNSLQILNDANNTYKNCKDLTIFFRDEKSYNFAKNEFKSQNMKVLLAPDIALYLNNMSKHNKKKKVIKLCLRNDREKNNSYDFFKILNEHFKNEYIINFTDTVTKYSIPLWKRKRAIYSKIKEFSESSIVITDRLHGMIFCVLSKTKCIAFDNKTKKVSGVYKKWLNKNDNIILLEENVTKKELIELIEKMLSSSSYNLYYEEKLNKQFEIMKNEIIGKRIEL